MKKFTLLLLCLPVALMAQQRIPVAPGAHLVNAPSALKNKAVPYTKKIMTGNEQVKGDLSTVQTAPGTAHVTSTLRDITATEVGTTFYDLQTNSSIYPRLSNGGDGTYSAVWTMAQTTNPWSDRGTGYNYFNGTSWMADPTTTIEGATRTGFTNVALTSDGGEHVVAHTGAGEPYLSERATKGTGTWNSSGTIIPSPGTGGSLWPRMVAGGPDGKTLHEIDLTTPTGNGGALYHGQDGALLYSRSTDGGATWDKNHVELPGLDSSMYNGFGGDAYAIDANGSTVAIVVGDYTSDWVLLKSTDNGDTWTKTVIWQFPIPFYASGQLTDVDGDGVADTIDTDDGSLAVLVDNNGIAHCWAGYNRVFNDGTATGFYYFPGENGLMYWNENMYTYPPEIIAGALDLDGDGYLNITAIATSYGAGLCTSPSAGIDASGNIYLSYRATLENTSDAVGNNINHSYLIYSKDEGTTWSSFDGQSGAVDYIIDPIIEGVYGSLARNVDNETVYSLVQEDYCAGIGVSGDDYCNVDQLNTMMVISIPNFVVGVPTINDTKSALKMYPVPSDGQFTINGIQSGTVNITVCNTLGQQVASFANQHVNGGEVNLDLTTLGNGMYTVSCESNGKTVSNKISIIKD